MLDVSEIQTIDHDVMVIGAGGAGLRAAIAASAHQLDTGVISKSLLGKAHTVMAEGGMAAAMGNTDPRDNWKVHFRDTMRGGKDCMSNCGKPTARLVAWKRVSWFNARHMQFAWASLVWVMVADLYVRLLSLGYIRDLNTW